MKTLAAVVVFILLAITAGGVTGYFLYTDLVKDTSQIIVRQQSQIDSQEVDIQSLQEEIKVLNDNDKTLNSNSKVEQKEIVDIVDILNKAFESPKSDESPSNFDKSLYPSYGSQHPVGQ
jgi:predicted PurR-regulated permease PerM